MNKKHNHEPVISIGLILPEDNQKNVSITLFGEKFDLLIEIYSNNENDPYTILQSNINDPIDQINKKRITLLKRHHPDVLIAKGQPLEFVEKNNHYVKMINKSWEYIKKNHNK